MHFRVGCNCLKTNLFYAGGQAHFKSHENPQRTETAQVSSLLQGTEMQQIVTASAEKQ